MTANVFKNAVTLSRGKHFSEGLNFYMLFWAFFLGSFIGVAAETLYCLVTNRPVTNTSGLIYGPFNFVYGTGALLMTMGLYWIRKSSFTIIMTAGMFIGGVVEFVCSFLQQLLFHSVSWNYANQPYNFFGRTSLKLSLFWGLLTIIWIDFLYPDMIKLIRKIPNSIAKPLTWALLLFMLINIFMSACAVWRWSERQSNQPAHTKIEVYMDKNYPDTRMKQLYPNLKFVSTQGDIIVSSN